MKILVTGGAGYIGSHTCIALLEAGHDLVVVDNYINSYPEVIDSIISLSGKKIVVYEGNMAEEGLLEKVFEGERCNAVIHLAALKAVGEGQRDPLRYYDHNLTTTLCLLKAMQRYNVKKLVFSSSATVYGTPQYLPYDEEHPCRPNTVYGKTKLIIEEILKDLFNIEKGWSIINLRYFNPAGAHKSGQIGERPKAHAHNLFPLLAQVASHKRPYLLIHGKDYHTKDGSPLRDYIHIMDIASAHLLAVEKLTKPLYETINLGSGAGYTVLEVIKTFEKVTKQSICYKVGPRRAGDLPAFYANAQHAQHYLEWTPRYSLEDMCLDLWNFERHLLKSQH